ncbi:MAG: proton-conducting transporter membrane subunit [Anaerolineae bacterium]|nr:proton-conducting transporter membrane subunit [Anaerolineae bacterium]
MNAPVIWIIFPGLLAGLLLLGRRAERITAAAAAVVALVLAWTAWQVPIGEALAVGSFSLKIAANLSVFGRDFVLAESLRPFLAMLYLVTAFWILGAYLAKPGNLFIPLALAIVSLLTAALAVEPFLFAALIIEIAVLLFIPLLAPPGKAASRGVFQFLSFQTLGMPFILFTGWMLAGVEASPSDLALVVRAGMLLGLGFAFLLAIFPFHSWMPMLGEDANPYVVAFLVFVLPGAVSLFGLGFLNRYTWLREAENIFVVLRSVGALMVVVGGGLAAFQTHLGRMLGYAAMLATGFSLLAIGLGGASGLELYFALFLPRALAFVFWGIGLSFFLSQSQGGLSFSAVRGLGLKFPFMAGTLLVSQFTTAGVPLFAGFPPRYALLNTLAGVHPAAAVSALIGSLGMLVGALRTMTALLGTPKGDAARLAGKPGGWVFLSAEKPQLLMGVFFAIVCGLNVMVGLFPHRFYAAFAHLLPMFDKLLP